MIFEIARGFLRSLIELHNASFEYVRFSDLHLAAYSGQRRFRHYEMHTWLGAMTDFQAALEREIGPLEGRMCHRCGDAIICLEAPPDHVIASKNEGDFQPISGYLGKPLSIARTAKTTADPNPSA